MVAVIAHRGRCDEWPENTLGAVRAACDGSANVVEIDVHLTLDGEVVVIHDMKVDRTTNGVGLVAALTLAEMQALEAGRRDGEPEAERVPLLREVLDVVAKSPDVRLLIELKFLPWGWRGWLPVLFQPIAGLAKAVVDVVQAHATNGGVRLSQIIVQSFVPAYLDQVRELESGIERHLLVPPVVFWGLPMQADVHALNLHARQVTAAAVAAIHATGKKVHVWTVDTEEEMRRCIAAGVDGVITNRVPGLRQVLALFTS